MSKALVLARNRNGSATDAREVVGDSERRAAGLSRPLRLSGIKRIFEVGRSIVNECFMDVVAVYCARCACFYLEPVYLVIEEQVSCECGATARQLPGERYSRRDETLFDAVVTSLRVADVSCLRAPALAAAFQGRESLPPGEALSRLTELQPELAVIELIARGEPRIARKAEAMLEAVLGAMATSRSRSGIMPRAGSGAAAVNFAGRR